MKANELIETYVDDVVSHLRWRQRNDVGVELRALLTEELQSQVEIAGRPADAEMAIDLLRRFGRPSDVAMRYRKAGFPLIEPTESPSFVWMTAIGMLGIWLVGLLATFRDGGGAGRLSGWWLTWGLGAFWWPGFLIVNMATAAWLRRRFPVADGWAIDRDRVNRPLWLLAIAFFTLGIIVLTSPAQMFEQLTGGRLPREVYAHFVYDEAFRQWRLPLLLILLTMHVALYAVVVFEGRWRRLTQRLDILFSVVITGLLLASLLGGRILQTDAADGALRLAVWLLVPIVLWDVIVKLFRERARVRMPVSPP